MATQLQCESGEASTSPTLHHGVTDFGTQLDIGEQRDAAYRGQKQRVYNKWVVQLERVVPIQKDRDFLGKTGTKESYAVTLLLGVAFVLSFVSLCREISLPQGAFDKGDFYAILGFLVSVFLYLGYSVLVVAYAEAVQRRAKRWLHRQIMGYEGDGNEAANAGSTGSNAG